ncbi:WhiB family transcriptional regulator (plasmid) [Rhodococcus rhodochrous]|uniref:WhiB family transcriptional regulator n=1 Tax=Rhodococcus rhodochrous TaxID=1829 RepID=UPI00132F03C6|nr:WhiB family transcriptional regulator [Rhodococcus rhodochrous]QHG85616.1 WhiB family transcriptional regulator [Rhodococcus rhodochrous]
MKTPATTPLSPTSPRRWDWQRSATCRSMGAALFFSPDGETDEARRYRESFAVRICRTCPVLAECRTHAQTVNEPFGIWGATTESDRRRTTSSGRRRRRTRRSGREHTPQLDAVS